MRMWMYWLRLSMIVCCMVVTSGWASESWANESKTHQESAFGLSFSLPEGWVALTPTQLDSLRESTTPDAPLALPKALLDQLMTAVTSEQMAVYFNSPTNGTGFADNLAIYPTSDQVPEGRDATAQICRQMPALLTEQMKRRIRLSQCRFINVAGQAALKLAYAGGAKRTQVIQVMAQRDENSSLLLTMTYHQESGRDSERAFEQLLASAKWLEQPDRASDTE